MKEHDLLAEYANGRRDFREVLLREANLQGLVMPNINLIAADLREANLSKTDLRCSLLGYTNLR
ncbi:MAG: pentapeptide repeat-containing protein [Coleofasciculaceae cyanobacterium]